MLAQSWSMAVISKYADGANNVPSVVGHLAFLFHTHAEITLPGFCLWRLLGLWMEGAWRLELLFCEYQELSDKAAGFKARGCYMLLLTSNLEG